MRDLVSKSLGDAFDHITERGVDLSEVSQRATRSEKKRDITDIVDRVGAGALGEAQRDGSF